MSRLQIAGETSIAKDQILQTVLEAVKTRIMVIKEEIHAIDADLKYFHERYNFSDEDFLPMFQSGELGDEEEDFFVWEGSLNLWKKLLEEESRLREVL
ncbi:MAG TPA: hypothetical protein VKK79_13215 [Candidatus Lokiarchaeia archaeon]|nr:hypothetical protein [Candidatus Lokiarchaeia archaeon]